MLIDASPWGGVPGRHYGAPELDCALPGIHAVPVRPLKDESDNGLQQSRDGSPSAGTNCTQVTNRTTTFCACPSSQETSHLRCRHGSRQWGYGPNPSWRKRSRQRRQPGAALGWRYRPGRDQHQRYAPFRAPRGQHHLTPATSEPRRRGPPGRRCAPAGRSAAAEVRSRRARRALSQVRGLARGAARAWAAGRMLGWALRGEGGTLMGDGARGSDGW
jgi:hypothetical protein